MVRRYSDLRRRRIHFSLLCHSYAGHVSASLSTSLTIKATQPPSAASPATVIIESSDVWDMTLPWLPIYWDMDILRRYRRAGYTFVSLTLQDWPPTFEGR